MANNRIQIGMDSRAALAVGTSGGITLENNAWGHWALMLSRQAAQLLDPLGDCYGAGGTTSDNWVQRVNPAPGSVYGGVLVMPPTNDRGAAALTAAQSIANMTVLLARYRAAGIKVGIMQDSPRGDAANPSQRLTGAQLTNHQIVRNWIKTLDDNQWVFVENAYPQLVDSASATADAIAGMLYDGLHFNIPGAFIQGQAGARLINRMFPGQQYQGPGSNVDLISADNPYGCINKNPMVRNTGTNGSLGTGGSGTIAGGWIGSTASGASGIGRSYTFDADGVQRCTLSGAGSGTAAALDILKQQSPHLQMIPGEIYEGFAEVEVLAGTSNMSSLQYGIECTDPVNGTQRYWDGDRYQQNTLLPSSAWSGVYRIPRFQCPAGVTSSNLRLTSYAMDNAPSTAMAVRVISATFRRVQQ